MAAALCPAGIQEESAPAHDVLTLVGRGVLKPWKQKGHTSHGQVSDLSALECGCRCVSNSDMVAVKSSGT